MTLTLEAIEALVGRQLGRRGVKADDHLVADLGVESVDLLNLVNAIEERYGVSVEDEELEGLETVRHLYDVVASRLGEGA